MEKGTIIYNNVKALTLVGLWPIEKSKYKFLHHIYSMALKIWATIFFTSQVIDIYFVHDDITELYINVSFPLLYLLTLSKIFNISFNKKKVTTLLNIINRADTEVLKGDVFETKNIVHEYVSRCWKLTCFHTSLVFLSLAAGTATPLIDASINGWEEVTFKNGTPTGTFKRAFILSSWFPFDKNSDENYPFAYTYQTVSAILSTTCLAFWDTFIFSAISFAIAQFKILQYSLRNISNYKGEKDLINGDILELKPEIRNNISKNFKHCVQHHYMIIEYVKILDKIISPIMFLKFCVYALMFCTIGLRAILEGFSFKTGFTLSYLTATVIELFGFYWLANELTLEGVNIIDAIWESNWYYCPNSIKKGLILMMRRAHVKITLSIGPLYVMSLETFIMILRAAYSYMAFLRQLYK